LPEETLGVDSVNNEQQSNKKPNDGERLQKVIAQAGIASRRHAEQMIIDGRVRVNGKKVVELGTKVNSKDVITVDGQKINFPKKKYEYYILHKPTGYITSAKDPQGRKTVMDLMRGVKVRVYPVGRLDYDTSGLLVLTNDGELAHRLMHPSFGVDKTYQVEVQGVISSKALVQLQQGIELEDGKTAPAQVRVISQKGQGTLQRLEITIHEGRNRQVRRMFEAVGFPVVNLKRLRFGPLQLDDELKLGKYRNLTEKEIELLKKAVELLA
jgi:23S rRNA pseudouridine2605 synthase